MIKSISSSGRYIQAIGGSAGTNYINHYVGAQGVGNMRFNTGTQNIEIYDGSNWVQMAGSHATVELSSEAVGLLDWVRFKRDEEHRLNELAKKNTTIANALENVKHAQEQLDIVLKLTDTY
jgi:hypothetical protein